MSYGAGALASLAVSVGALLVLVGFGALTVDLLEGAGVVLAMLGGFTLAYAAVSREPFYHLIWGGILFGIGVGAAAHSLISPVAVLGIVILFVGAVGAFVAIKRRA